MKKKTEYTWFQYLMSFAMVCITAIGLGFLFGIGLNLAGLVV